MTIAPLPLQHGHASVLGDPRPLGVLPLALILRDPSRLPALIVAPSSAHRRAFQRSSSRPSALIVTPSSAHHRALPPRPTRLCMRRRPPPHPTVPPLATRSTPFIVLNSARPAITGSSKYPRQRRQREQSPLPSPPRDRAIDSSVSNLRCSRRRGRRPRTRRREQSPAPSTSGRSSTRRS